MDFEQKVKGKAEKWERAFFRKTVHGMKKMIYYC